MDARRAVFLAFCAEITGFTPFDLEGTGVVDLYQRLIEEILGSELASEFYRLAESIVSIPDAAGREQAMRECFLPPSILWPVISGLIALWYLGTWTRLPDSWYAATGLPIPGPNDAGRTHTPSGLAYIEQLSYRTAGAHTPGVNPTGFGSWSSPPLF
jgi:hypothetical protein